MPTDLFTHPISQPAQQLARLGARRRELLAQERDALTALDAARAEHSRLQRVIADDEAKALALGDEPAVPKGAHGKLDKLGQQVTEHTTSSDRLARAIVALDDEARRVTMTNAEELPSEAIAAHDQARERIADLVAELNEQQATLRSAYAAAQRILATAGQSARTARLRDVPSVEVIVRENGEVPALIHDDDRAIAA